jgi:hypothetical protein
MPRTAIELLEKRTEQAIGSHYQPIQDLIRESRELIASKKEEKAECEHDWVDANLLCNVPKGGGKICAKCSKRI